MKKIALIIALLFAGTTLSAETLIQTFTGKLRGTDTKDVHTLDLKKGNYRYELILKGDKRARARIRINKKRLSGTWVKLIDAKKIKSHSTNRATFRIDVRGIVGQNTNGTRETKFKITKKAGPRQIKYTLKVYKK